MARPKRVTCVGCDRHVDDCGPLSSRALCEDCGLGRLVANIDGLIRGEGEAFERWRAGVVRSAEAILAKFGGS